MAKNTFKAKAITAAKTVAKLRADYVCEKCGRSLKQGWQIHGAHIMPVTWAGTAADPFNILALCASCHSVGRGSQHQDSIPFARWLDKEFPGRYDECREKALNYSKTKFPKINWEEVLNTLQAEIKELEGL